MLVDGQWALLTTTFLVVLYIAQGGVVLSSVIHLSHVSGAEWRADIGPYAHQTVRLYPLALVLLLILLAVPDATFPYYAEEDVHLNAWHNYPFLVSRELIMFLLVAAVNYGYVRASARDHHENTAASRKTLTRYAAMVPFLYFIYSTLVAWDFEMTLQAGWHSPMYAPYFFVSNFHMFLGFFVMMLYLVHIGHRRRLVAEQSFNYLAQMMLGLTLLWVYTFFFQFITIWYGNLPQETGRLYAMMYEAGDIRRDASALAPFFWWFIALKSFIPFGLLIFAVVRHTPGLIALVGSFIFIGTLLERYTWIGSAYPTWHTPLSNVTDFAIVTVVGIYVILKLRSAFRGKRSPLLMWLPGGRHK